MARTTSLPHSLSSHSPIRSKSPLFQDEMKERKKGHNNNVNTFLSHFKNDHLHQAQTSMGRAENLTQLSDFQKKGGMFRISAWHGEGFCVGGFVRKVNAPKSFVIFRMKFLLSFHHTIQHSETIVWRGGA